MPTEQFTGTAKLSKLSVANNTLVVEPNVFNVTTTGAIILDAPVITFNSPIVDMKGAALTNVPPPVNATDAATREFVETQITNVASLNKAPVFLVSAGFEDGNFSGMGPGAKFISDNPPGEDITRVGLRILYADKINLLRNGIWVISTITDTAYEAVRATDCNQSSDIQVGTTVINGKNLITWVLVEFGRGGEIDVGGQTWVRQLDVNPTLGTSLNDNEIVVNTDARFTPTWGADHTWADGKGVASGADRELSMTHAGVDAGTGGLIQNTAGTLAITNTAGDTVLASEGEDSKTVVVVAGETNLFAVAATQANAADASKRLFAIHNTGAMQVSVDTLVLANLEGVPATGLPINCSMLVIDASNITEGNFFKLANGFYGQVASIMIKPRLVVPGGDFKLVIVDIGLMDTNLALNSSEGSSITIVYTTRWELLSSHNVDLTVP
jgi:hypothetical protein